MTTRHQTVIVGYELTQAKALYCYTLDSRDWGALAELMTNDIELDLSDDDPHIPIVTGRQAAIDLLRTRLDKSRSVHQAHLPSIDLTHDTARVVWTVHERIIWDDGRTESGYGHHRERWVRTHGEWKLATLRLTRLLLETEPSPAAPPGTP